MLTQIRTALINHYQSGGFLLPINNENTSNEKPLEYVSVYLIPTDTNALTMGDNGENRHKGMMQFDVTIAKGVGSKKANDIASDIINHFKIGLRLTTDNVTTKINKAYSSQGRQTENKYIVSVTVHWQTDIAR